MTEQQPQPETTGETVPRHEPLKPLPGRRNFLTSFFAGLVGAVVGLVPLVAGVVFFLDPLARKKKSAAAEDGDTPEFVPVGYVENLPQDGTPQFFRVKKDVTDAWNLYPNQPVGSVWLRKVGDQVIAFNTVCPHLGCSVNYRAAREDFYCPCHESAFDLDGEKKNVIPPRDMDALEVKVEDDGRILVAFQNFLGATSEKVPVS